MYFDLFVVYQTETQSSLMKRQDGKQQFGEK